ncbi:MAG: energy transducer TonB [Bacteroidetes bacterium SB0662_bin_6]|nr:energy transducer TonB [Bacteroidetes bacterium SB0662_bin_6]
MALHKEDKFNLKNKYTLYMEAGLIVTLGILIVAFRADWSNKSDFEIVLPEQEQITMEEIQQTQQIEQPPPPPKPPVPVEVPNDEILEDDILDLDASLDLDAPAAALPPPPPPPEEEDEEPEIFVIVEQMPEPIGGIAAIQAEVKYPEIARKAGVEGRVFLQFVVNEQGNVQDVVVSRGIGAGCDEEAIRAVEQAKFTPGKQRGKPVKVRMSLPITFKLK